METAVAKQGRGVAGPVLPHVATQLKDQDLRSPGLFAGTTSPHPKPGPSTEKCPELILGSGPIPIECKGTRTNSFLIRILQC